MRPSCSMAMLPEARTSPASGSAVTAGLLRDLRLQTDPRAEIEHGPVSATPGRLFRMPLVSATALHVTCLAAALMFTHEARPLAPLVVELVVQPEPAAVKPAPNVPTAAMTEPEAALMTPLEKPNSPAADQPQALAASRSMAEQSLAPTESIITRAENLPQASAPDSSGGVLPHPRSLPPPPRPANHQVHSSAAQHSVKAARVEIPTNAPRPSSRGAATAAGDRPLGSAVALQRAPLPAQAADQQSALEARIRDAVQAAVHYPAAARMMGVTGQARVRLDYRSGVVDDPSLAQSSGAPMLDHAAISAAQTAHYPAPPPELAGRLMRFLVWVEFRSA